MLQLHNINFQGVSTIVLLDRSLDEIYLNYFCTENIVSDVAQNMKPPGDSWSRTLLYITDQRFVWMMMLTTMQPHFKDETSFTVHTFIFIQIPTLLANMWTGCCPYSTHTQKALSDDITYSIATRHSSGQECQVQHCSFCFLKKTNNLPWVLFTHTCTRKLYMEKNIWKMGHLHIKYAWLCKLANHLHIPVN